MILWLQREGSIRHKGTFGQLKVVGMPGKFATVECEWKRNYKNISCIPTGLYEMKWQATSTSVPQIYAGHTWHLEGQSVGPGKHRTGIVFHIGNTKKDVQGCIAVGESYGNSWNVVNSRVAMERLFHMIGTEDHHLVIT